MALTFTEVFAIQAAIDAYETKFPGRPAPSPEEALAWQAGGRGRKQLSGLVLHDALQDVLLLGAGGGEVTAKIQLRVVRSATTGLLDFDYRIFTGASPLGGPTHMVFFWFPPPAGIKVTLADFRSEGVSTVAPDDFVCAPPWNNYGFTFSKGVPAHASTGFFFRVHQCAGLCRQWRGTWRCLPARNGHSPKDSGAGRKPCSIRRLFLGCSRSASRSGQIRGLRRRAPYRRQPPFLRLTFSKSRRVAAFLLAAVPPITFVLWHK